MRRYRTIWFTLVLSLLLAGCATPPRSVYVPPGEQGIATVEMDDKDYDLVAKSMFDALAEETIPSRGDRLPVVALASVNTDDCNYLVQTTTLQKAIQVVMRKAKRLRFTRAIEANQRDPMVPELYQAIEWNYWKGNPIDAEEVQKYGKLADVDCLLFGRVSEITRRQWGLTEVTYRFTWELVDCQTGEVVWDHLRKIRKNIR